MSKRLIALLLALGGLIAILAVLYWAFQPLLSSWLDRSSSPVQQTTGSGNAVDQGAPQAPQADQGAPAPSPDVVVDMDELQEKEALGRAARDMVGRAGTYSSVNGFTEIDALLVRATPEFQAQLKTQKATLAKEHPASGWNWSQGTRALSANVTSPQDHLKEAARFVVVVETQVITTEDGQPDRIRYERANVRMNRISGGFQISAIEYEPLTIQ